MSMNKLVVAGNLAADARHNRVNDESFAVSFTVIANKSVKDDKTESGYRDIPTPYQVTRFLPTAESAEKFAKLLMKGRRVEVEGAFRKQKPNTNPNNGKTYHGWAIIADEVELGAKPKVAESA